MPIGRPAILSMTRLVRPSSASVGHLNDIGRIGPWRYSMVLSPNLNSERLTAGSRVYGSSLNCTVGSAGLIEKKL
ncbi:hypothetical protein D3C81_1062660 [compost metagenome]